VNIVRRWYDQDGVDAIFGIGNSGIERGRGAMTALSAWYGLKVSRGLYA
jgi:hypothetical protein